MNHFYKKLSETEEECFTVEGADGLTTEENDRLIAVLSDDFSGGGISEMTKLNGDVVEIGPRLSFATAFSTNAVGIVHAAGLTSITRIEKSRRTVLPAGTTRDVFLTAHADRMTEQEYTEPLVSFAIDAVPAPVTVIQCIEEGISALQEVNQEMGLGMDAWDEKFYYDLFVNDFKRNPTNVECFQLGQANSEHSRHWFFNGKLVIDGKEMERTLFDIVRAPLKAHDANSTIAFKDNSSAMKGFDVTTIMPETSGASSRLAKITRTYDMTFTAETHNFPTGVAPFPGATTGTGGRLRDGMATGTGSLVTAGTAGYCVGHLHIPGYTLPWEDDSYEYPENLASPRDILTEASNGASDYGNKFGEPVIQGFVRSFGMTLPSGERREWLKPIMFTAGVGQIDRAHQEKKAPEKGMRIIQVGGPAYRIGIGGGSASSMIQGANAAHLDFNAVQRGDPEMEQKMNRVVRACVEMGDANPIVSIHDQGAGGPCNVVTEITEPAGGKIDIRNVHIGDTTLSVLEIWGGEYQERDALLLRPEHVEVFAEICRRERVAYENLGEVTGDGRVVVYDSLDDTTPVDLELAKILGDVPQKTFEDTTAEDVLTDISLPGIEKLPEMTRNVLRLTSVGSKRFLTNKADRSVTGLIAQQQCVGPLQLPMADVAVVAQSHFGLTGTAISIGEQPVKMMIDAGAGARMSVAEMLTNMMWARIGGLDHIKCAGNWMLAAKLPGEGAVLYRAADAMSTLMIELGIAIDGGKDSLSMAAKVGEEIVKSPSELTVSGYADMRDITQVVTPDIKRPGESKIYFIDGARGEIRMGGSALYHTMGSIGNVSPDVDDAILLAHIFHGVQDMIDEGVILAGHDRSDGGLMTTILEMAFAGNCGVSLTLPTTTVNAVAYLYNEEVGAVVEVSPSAEKAFHAICTKNGLTESVHLLGETTQEKDIVINIEGKKVLAEDMRVLRQSWEETSYQMELRQTEKAAADAERENIYDQVAVPYVWQTTPELTAGSVMDAPEKPRVAIVREEGSNGDREMTSAFYSAGFETWDVTMSDLLAGTVTLADFRGVAFVGGFSYSDVLGSAKGWASGILYNEKLKKEFDDFYKRSDTFSFGVCNGAQLMGLLGWVPGANGVPEKSVQFVHNDSGRFESRWSTVKVEKSPAVMMQGMEGSVLGVWVAHGEGKLKADAATIENITKNNLAPLRYIDDNSDATELYPFNPNGSPEGITALCSADGRHLAMMPHPERAFLAWQWPWMPQEQRDALAKNDHLTPWMKMFQNARKWCDKG